MKKQKEVKVEVKLTELGDAFEMWNPKTKRFEKPSKEYLKNLPDKNVTLY